MSARVRVNISALRALETVAPDDHSMTRFAPFVSMPPEWRDALAEVVEAADDLRDAEGHAEHAPEWLSEARARLDTALDALDFAAAGRWGHNTVNARVFSLADLRHDAELAVRAEADGYRLDSLTFDEAVLALVEAVEAARAYRAAEDLWDATGDWLPVEDAAVVLDEALAPFARASLPAAGENT